MKEKIEKIGKKKLWFIGGFFILILIILFGGAFLYNKLFYKRSYAEVEEIMLSAGQNYFKKNASILPKNYNDVVQVTEQELVDQGLMKNISEYIRKENVTCNGNVTVTNINGEYRYTPILDCGNQYQTVKFIDYIKKNVAIVSEGNGLYNLNEELVYRGDDVNNYLKFSGHIYRIVKFSGDSPVIILTEKLESTSWDNRYNVDKNSNMGINDYSVSRVKEYLDKLYQDESFIRKDKKLLAVAHSLEVGKRAGADTDKTGGLEKSAIIENQFIGLLPLYDYLNASLDQNCTTSISPSCVNYNYLAKYRFQWWTMSATNLNSYRVYRINGGPGLSTASNTAYLRPVLHLTKDALYVSGDGTKDNPYILK